MKKPTPEPPLTQLDPNHPNYDAILLKRARLEAHRRRRRENRGELDVPDRKQPPAKPGKKPLRRRED